ncbi:MAG: flagellar motor protein MotA, partial [Hyphomicrobium sp.]
LVFLGLLGTFWGLLETMQSVGKAIQALDTKGEAVAIFDELKTGLAAPLKGMGTAFSSSLLGLAGSLILGFLELQANQAHNRFYNELEEWLSGITELTPGTTAATDQASRQLTSAVYEMQRAISELSDKLETAQLPNAEENKSLSLDRSEDSVKELARSISQLINLMRSEQKVVREWVDEQATQKTDLANAIKVLNENFQRRSS